MSNPVSRALVPVIKNLPAVIGWDRKPRAKAKVDPKSADFNLVRQETHLRDSDEVERFLPDILGRALARIWIDPIFRDRFAAGPKETLAAYGVHLPKHIHIDFETDGVPRPQVVVFEQSGRSKPKRLLSLRLTMIAVR